MGNSYYSTRDPKGEKFSAQFKKSINQLQRIQKPSNNVSRDKGRMTMAKSNNFDNYDNAIERNKGYNNNQ